MRPPARPLSLFAGTSASAGEEDKQQQNRDVAEQTLQSEKDCAHWPVMASGRAKGRLGTTDFGEICQSGEGRVREERGGGKTTLTLYWRGALQP